MKAAVRSGDPLPPGFRDYLREELARRCARNAQYSLRAFAIYLGVHHSTLSQLMRGKRTVTRAVVEKFGFKLGLKPEEIERYVQIEASRPGRSLPDERTQLARDTAGVLEDWRNFAILELTRLSDFQPDSRWIARMLGITVDEVNVAVSRLCRLRLLRMDKDGWKDQLGDVVMDPEHFHEAALRGMIEQLIPAHTSATIAVPARLAPAALEKLGAFSREFLEWLEKEPGKDEVYRFEIRFAPLTRREQ